MKGSLDASVLVSIIFGDAGSDRLAEWLEGISDGIVISDFCRGEFVAVVGRKVRSRDISKEAADAVIDRVEAFIGGWETTPVLAEDVVMATTMLRRFELRLRLPDAIHIAIAQRTGAMLVTTDHGQRDAARALGVPVHDPLEDHA